MILVDTGPLVALLDRNDRHHEVCREAARRLPATLHTVWPVVTEAAYLLEPVRGGAEALVRLIGTGRLALFEIGAPDAPRLEELLRKYADLPMDLADATLVRVAEREGIRRVFTLDRRHFAIYRFKGRGGFDLVP